MIESVICLALIYICVPLGLSVVGLIYLFPDGGPDSNYWI